MNRNRFSSSPSDLDQGWWFAPLSVVVLAFAALALVGVEVDFTTVASAPSTQAVSMVIPAAGHAIGDDLVVAPDLPRASSARELDAAQDGAIAPTSADENHPASF